MGPIINQNEQNGQNGNSRIKLTPTDAIEKLENCFSIPNNSKIMKQFKRLADNFWRALNKTPWDKLNVPLELTIPVFSKLLIDEKERLKSQKGIFYFPTFEECLLVTHIANPLRDPIPEKFSSESDYTFITLLLESSSEQAQEFVKTIAGSLLDFETKLQKEETIDKVKDIIKKLEEGEKKKNERQIAELGNVKPEPEGRPAGPPEGPEFKLKEKEEPKKEYIFAKPEYEKYRKKIKEIIGLFKETERLYRMAGREKWFGNELRTHINLREYNLIKDLTSERINIETFEGPIESNLFNPKLSQEKLLDGLEDLSLLLDDLRKRAPKSDFINTEGYG